MNAQTALRWLAAGALFLGCAEEGGDSPEVGDSPATSGGDTDEPSNLQYAVVSVVITDAGRTTYVHAVDQLTGHLSNDEGVEVPGNAEVFVDGRNVYIGLIEEPTWVKYRVDSQRRFQEEGRMSLASYGLRSVDFGNALVDATTAVSIASEAQLAIVWSPETMTIRGTIDLPHLEDPDFQVENWTTTAHNGLVYVPSRWSNLAAATVAKRVNVTIIDPQALSVVGIADDDRCYSGGRVVFDEAGYGYVMGDGRNFSAQLAATLREQSRPENCLLRIPPGGTDFEQSYFFTIPSLTGGLDSITELETSAEGSGVAFAKMFHEDQLPADYEIADFGFWNFNAHKLWRIDLGDVPTATPIEGAPFSIVGYQGKPLDGMLWVGESEDAGATSTVYAVDPQTNSMAPAFTMDGFYNGLYALSEP